MKYLFIALQCITLATNAQSADSLINKESLYKNVSFLASDSLKGRLTGSPSIVKAADYIRDFLSKTR